MYDPLKNPTGHSLADARLAAWTILLGHHNEVGFYRRPHRGMLPDIVGDFDAPPPRRRSLVERLAAFIRAIGTGRAPAMPVSGAANVEMGVGLGECAPVTYIEGSRLSREADSTETKARAA